MNRATKDYYNNKQILTIEALLDDIEMNEINYAEVLVKRINEEKADNNFSLEKFLYGKLKVKYSAREYYKNENGIMDSRFVTKTRTAYTSNATEKLLKIVDLCNKYDCPDLNKFLSEAIKYAVENEGEYVNVSANNEVKDGPFVLDTDFDTILAKYLRISDEKQDKNTLLSFFKKYEKIDEQCYDELDDTTFKELNYLGDSGYKAVMKLFSYYKDELTVSDMSKIGHYVNFRLRRMENVMSNFGKNEVANKAINIIKRNNSGNVPSYKEVDEVINALEKVDRNRFDELRAKYNHELSKYLVVVRKIKGLYDSANPKGNRSIDALLRSIRTTRIIINESDLYKKNAVKNDEYKDMLLDIPVKRPSRTRTI